MSIIGWVIIGFFAGWLAGVVTGTGKKFGCCMDVVVGIVGAFVGGFIFSYIEKNHVTFQFNWWSFFVAFVGATVLLIAFRIIARLVSGPSRD
jgi:uncharacterized membrane protein YeaQ/YmgE (transglycosylase-associated protein family)